MQECLIFHQGIIFCHRITCNKWFFQTCKKHPLTLTRLRGQALWDGEGVCGKKEVEEASPISTSQNREGSSCRSLGEKIFDWIKVTNPRQGKRAQGRAQSAWGSLKKIQKTTSFARRSISCSAPAERGPRVSSNQDKRISWPHSLMHTQKKKNTILSFCRGVFVGNWGQRCLLLQDYNRLLISVRRPFVGYSV